MTSGRVISGAIGIAVALVSVVAVGRLDLPVVAVEAPSTTVTPTASDQSRLCPGPLLRQGDDAGSAGAAAGFGRPGATIATGTPPEQTALTAPDNLSGEAFGLPTVVSVASEPGQDTPLIGAAQSQVAGLDDLTGFAATACGEVSADSWLVGGSSDVGRSTLLSLNNPTRADSIVDLSFYSETGEVEAPGARGIIVNAGEQRLFSLASFAPGVRTPVIRVQTTGGQVSAVLQQSIVRGVTPGGVELSSATTPPATDQTISGVVLAASAPRGTAETYDDAVAAIRVFVPGTDPAEVTVEFVSEQGAEAPPPLTYDFEGGIVSEVTLNSLPTGSYAVSITSDQPVVAAARTTAAAGELTDFAWFGASGSLADETAIAVAPGQGPRLHLFNPASADADIVLTDRNGGDITLTVPAGSAIDATLRSGMSYEVSGAEGIHAQVSYWGSAGFSAYAIQPASPSASPVTVYPR
ncbi:hypothetical protein IWX78_002558 [Mycetocola sp. CAN_C7]|uniref:DUF5719 family protein n=1 Tax=Mycetocola sp. CAN_C7 TaxID=2787724 RepID=UPI0018CAE919